MNKKANEDTFISKVQKALEPIGNTTYTAIDDKTLGLYKDNIMFGFIKGTELYLRANEDNPEIFSERQNFQGNRYNKLRYRFPLSNDSFIQTATESYWIACGKR